MTKTEKQKMLDGEEYFAFDDELSTMRQKTFDATMKFNTTGDKKYLKELFLQEFDNLKINPPFYCDYGENIKFEKDVFVNFNCSFLSCALIEIGEHTYIGPNVQIYTAIHPIIPEERIKDINSAKPVTIGKHCWIGGGAIILPGVKIGDGVTIGAGSVVTKDIPSRTVAAGNPCKILKEI